MHHSFSQASLEIDRPKCVRCGTRMGLTRIEPEKPGYDKRTFECPACTATRTEIIKYN